MSAICGVVQFGDEPLRLGAFDQMMRASEHHGPDGTGRWNDGHAALGHHMMHNTPESLNERLPLHFSDDRIALTAHARLDNREELFSKLNISCRGAVADSELILRAFQTWGPTCAEHFEGEFAAAIWDARHLVLHLISDPMGIRPLFYRQASTGSLVFASEVAMLIAASDGAVALNHRRLAMLGVSAMSVYLEPESTCFVNTFRVPAATVLSIGRSGIKRTQYWQPDPGKRLHFRSDAECREAFREVFDQAVSARLRSAFPVASLLSGGLDSSAIAGTAGDALGASNRKLVTLSVVPMDSGRANLPDERKFIALFKSRQHLDMHEVKAEGDGPFENINELVKSASLCSYSWQHFLYTALVREARKHGVRTLLDGDGGEIAASCTVRGYLAELLLSGRWKRLAMELKSIRSDGKIRWSDVKGRVVRPLLPRSILKYLNRQTGFSELLPWPIDESFVRDILGPELDDLRDEVHELIQIYPDHRCNIAHDALLERRDVRQRSHAGFVDNHLAEFSYPFLDRRIIEFGLAVDGRFHCEQGVNRRLLRISMEGRLPEPIRYRTDKVPFCTDYPVRYARAKSRAEVKLREFSSAEDLIGIVDFSKALESVKASTDNMPKNPMVKDRDSQLIVPNALYLCYFLQRFGGHVRPRYLPT